MQKHSSNNLCFISEFPKNYKLEAVDYYGVLDVSSKIFHNK